MSVCMRGFGCCGRREVAKARTEINRGTKKLRYREEDGGIGSEHKNEERGGRGGRVKG